MKKDQLEYHYVLFDWEQMCYFWSRNILAPLIGMHINHHKSCDYPIGSQNIWRVQPQAEINIWWVKENINILRTVAFLTNIFGSKLISLVDYVCVASDAQVITISSLLIYDEDSAAPELATSTCTVCSQYFKDLSLKKNALDGKCMLGFYQKEK